MKKLLTVVALAVSIAVSSAAVAPAIIEPKECRTLKIRSHRVLVKADQIRCDRSVDIMKDYIRYKKRPKGWTCRTNPDTKYRWRCYRGARESIGIKRN